MCVCVCVCVCVCACLGLFICVRVLVYMSFHSCMIVTIEFVGEVTIEFVVDSDN